jgi:hypothetical protein
MSCGAAAGRLGTVAPFLNLLRRPSALLPRLAYLTLCRSIQLLALLAHDDAAKDAGDPRPAPPTRCAAPPDTAAQAGAHRPSAARCHQPRLAPITLVLVPRQAGDAAGLAPTAGRRRLDLPAPPHRPATVGPGGAAADHPPGQGEPSLGVTSASRANSSTWASGSRPPPSARCCRSTNDGTTNRASLAWVGDRLAARRSEV